MISMVDAFVETREYRRFRDFCDACRDNRYIGLCHGPPGVGKTLSARRYANWDEMEAFDIARDYPPVSVNLLHGQAIFYTAKVLNRPTTVLIDIELLRGRLKSMSFSVKEVHIGMKPRLEDAQHRRQKELDEFRDTNFFWNRGLGFKHFPLSEPTLEKIRDEQTNRKENISDPTQLILIDEADRLKIQSLEQVREIFDESEIGVVLIGMPGLEKKLARYPQLYSRVGFVHEYRPLKRDDVRSLLRDQWRPADLVLPEGALTDEDGIASIIRITGGNFRLLQRLITQIARVLDLNGLQIATPDVVETARMSLVIGTD
jgi:DNA transposition AAA+ family ATPase